MDVQAAKMIGIGLAMIPLLGVGTGLGTLFGSVITVMGRNPAMSDTVKTTGLVYFALIEAIAIYALAIALFIQYVF